MYKIVKGHGILRRGILHDRVESLKGETRYGGYGDYGSEF